MARPKMLKLPEVLEEIEMSRAAFYRMRARGKAPRLIKLPLHAIVPTASHRRQLSHTRPSAAITIPDTISGRLSGGSRTHMTAHW